MSNGEQIHTDGPFFQRTSLKIPLFLSFLVPSPTRRVRPPLPLPSCRDLVVVAVAYTRYEVQDLHVQETMPQLIGLSESYIIIYERKRGA